MTWWVVTGGIGSGKSAVVAMVGEAGLPVVDADAVGHEILDGPAREEVAARWPEVVLGGAVDRRELAAVVFADPGELTALEAITHPGIVAEIERRMVDDAGVVEVSVAHRLLGEDLPVAVVDAPDELRRRRLLDRGMSPADVDARLAAQPDRAAWLALATVVIDNSGDLAHLRRQVDRWLETVHGWPLRSRPPRSGPARGET